ncbi:hypothetical protein [Bacillus gaemokensis]|uniref:hypothetical protein n=1 Tax=Bacillus gaemokensis TaxID=574375 RepID=UPI000ABE92FF|nr:hypothetical protein [Bacillus gaemokensis]
MKTYNYHPYIDDYMQMVESGEINACKEQKQLMEFIRWKLDQQGEMMILILNK